MDKYEYVGDLGEGSFGVAKLYRLRDGYELFAIKFIDRGPTIDENVEREIINHRLLRHPNIISFKELILTPTHLALVMEYASGGELFERIRKRGSPFTEDQARYFFRQLISGLKHIHRMNICHRDLKLDNILLDGNEPPCLKICDFGYSKRMQHRDLEPRIIVDINNDQRKSSVHMKKYDYGSLKLHERPYTIVGNTTYTAPEILSGRGSDGKMADVWSCGVTLYVMLVGAYPFEDPKDPKNYEKTIKRIMDGRYEIPDHLHISEECQHLFSSIFVQNPSKRISIKEIMSHSWYLKNIESELMEPVQEFYYKRNNPNFSRQSMHKIESIVAEAKRTTIKGVQVTRQPDQFRQFEQPKQPEQPVQPEQPEQLKQPEVQPKQLIQPKQPRKPKQSKQLILRNNNYNQHLFELVLFLGWVGLNILYFWWMGWLGPSLAKKKLG